MDTVPASAHLVFNWLFLSLDAPENLRASQYRIDSDVLKALKFMNPVHIESILDDFDRDRHTTESAMMLVRGDRNDRVSVHH